MTRKQLVVDPWLEAYLETVDRDNPVTYDRLVTIGQHALTAKIIDTENNNSALPTKHQRKLPTKLTFDEITAIMVHIFTFRLIYVSKRSDDTLLGIYVPHEEDIWQEAGRRPMQGTYVTQIDFFFRLMDPLAPYFKKKDMQDVLDRISRVVLPVNVTTEPHLFPVKNGVFNAKTQTLEPFTPDYIYLTKIQVAYDAHASNPVITEPDGSTWDVDTWLRDLAIDDDVNTLLWQVIAASLQPNRGYNKSIWFYSQSGNNGKGTVGQLIKNLLGPDNYASLSVADFKHEFLKETLIGVAANIADENDVETFIDSIKDYKASVTGDDVMINRKYLKPIRLQFRGLNIQMMNGLPRTRDKTDSFYRRLIIVPFIVSFTNNGEKSYIKSDFIHRTDVLEYVLHKALHLEMDEFIVPKASMELLNQYKEKNNPVLDFWNDVKDEFVWDLLPSAFLYNLFNKWYEQNNPSGQMLAKRTFLDLLGVIIDMDPEWENHIDRDKSNVRSKGTMDDDEPMITDYGLHKDNGKHVSPWINQNYKGTNKQDIRNFNRKDRYRGVLRIT